MVLSSGIGREEGRRRAILRGLSEGQRRHKMVGIFAQDHLHPGALLHEQAQQFTGFVGRNSARNPKNDIFSRQNRFLHAFILQARGLFCPHARFNDVDP